MKSGDISTFADGTTVTNVNSTAHGLQTNDVIKIIDSRTQQYIGNHVITLINANSFSIPVTFVNVDGVCTWEQTQVHVTAMADSGTSPGVKTTLTMTAHPYVDNDWLNVTDATNGVTGSFQVSNKTANTVDIIHVFTVTSTANTNVGYGSMVFDAPHFVNAGTGKLWNLQGKPDATSFINLSRIQIINFELGTTRDSSVGYANGGLMLECFGHKSLGDSLIGLSEIGYVRIAPAFLSKSYLSLVESDGALTGGSVALHIGRPTFFLNQSFINFPTTANPNSNGVTIIGVLSDPSPGVYYKDAERIRGTTFPTGSVGVDMVIPVDDTSRFRVSDTVDLGESSNANTTGAIIQTIVKNTSVTVDFNQPTNPTGTTDTTVTDIGNGQITILCADTTLANMIVGDTIDITGATPSDYNGRHVLLNIINAGGTDPTITIAGTADPGNISVQGTVTGNAGIVVISTLAALASQTEVDPLLDVSNSKGTPDSMIEVEADFLNTSGTTVTINTLGVAEKIGTTLWVSKQTQRATIATNGVITYDGLRTKDILVNFSATIERTTGTPTLGIGIGLFKNGVLISGFEYARSFNAGKVQISGSRILNMATTDTMELVVINFDNTVDIDVFQANVVWNETS